MGIYQVGNYSDQHMVEDAFAFILSTEWVVGPFVRPFPSNAENKQTNQPINQPTNRKTQKAHNLS